MAQLCKELDQWIEETIQKQIEEWIKDRVKRCKAKKCKKWCLCCNKWFCWLEIIFLQILRDIVVVVGRWIIKTICEALNLLLNLFAMLISVVFWIPFFGRILHQIWNTWLDFLWRVAGSPGAVLDLVGVDVPKKLRICIVIFSSDGTPLSDPFQLAPSIANATIVWKKALNVSLIVENILTVADVPDDLLTVDCDFAFWRDDLLLNGSLFAVHSTHCFDGAWRRLLGWAAPVTVFVIKDVVGKRGCSLGAAGDYVVIEGRDQVCLAHELGHACYPLMPSQHHPDPKNLMYRTCGGTEVEGWQRILIRNSRHVTYL